jgi:hypothetical protein
MRASVLQVVCKPFASREGVLVAHQLRCIGVANHIRSP